MKFYSLVLSALCACVPTILKAQGQNPHSHEWNGNSVVSVANSTNEDIKTAYLYNVGTGQYLNAGSYWGTVVVGYGVGMPITSPSRQPPANTTCKGHKQRQRGATLPLVAEKTRRATPTLSTTIMFM